MGRREGESAKMGATESNPERTAVPGEKREKVAGEQPGKHPGPGKQKE